MLRKIIFVVALVVMATLNASAQTGKAFQGRFFTQTFNMELNLNLLESDIPVPGLELETCYGYLRGNINGLWSILRVKQLKDDYALVRAVSERGGDAQDIELRINEDGTLQFRLVDDNNIKGIEGRKYAKMPKNVSFKK